MNQQAIFIASTGQNIGKTTLSLGILAGLQRRFSSVGFMKPVGQEHVQTHTGIRVDKDVVLFKEHFQIGDAYEDMSPVLLPRGFTQRYLEGKEDVSQYQQKIQSSFERIAHNNEFTVVEGTGHVGVGTIIDMNNARVAKELGLDVVLVASAGIGSAFDELALNVKMCQQYGVNVRGVILNRVIPEKREMILNLFPKALERWGIPLIGAIPFSNFLNTPTMRDFEILFKTRLLAGEENRMRHFEEIHLVAGSLESYNQYALPNELVITPACRLDIIKRVLHLHSQPPKENREQFCGGMILTGRLPPTPEVIELIGKGDVPILYAPICSYDAMKQITSYIAKIRTEDTPKVEKAIQLVEEHLDFERLCTPHHQYQL